MTCIVGLVDDGNIYMGADSAWGNMHSHQCIKEGKIFGNGNYLFGCAGSARQAQLLNYAFIPPIFRDGDNLHKFMVVDFSNAVRECFKSGGLLEIKDGVERTDGSCLVGTKGILFYIGYNLQITESLDGYQAIGCGENWAMGSMCSTEDMFPKDRIKIALKAAAKYSGGVCSPFKIKVLKG